MQPGNHFSIDLPGIIDSHTMCDHRLPRTCCFESVGCFLSLELDTDVKIVRGYMYDRKFLALVQDANI